ncbi:AMP-dependent synthetase and ligase [Magnetospirillum sp. XM-1]|uniref:AMP-binding protein n=1 Tax=Magnetospirillum sp. XM-1 TaxID=1663591 RepID=UPI00073E0A67|nr:class I adenylate-forming enzyme family protein [Magnetospirillum sp. XM-1]CUW39363.1 AMP-dependent synthetase and ligase [Magnetospirillum sp. XM-1]
MNAHTVKPGALNLRPSIAIDPAERRALEAKGIWGDDTLSGWIADNVTRSGNAPAVVTNDHTATYLNLANDIERFARGLYDLGVRTGDVVSVQLPNSYEFIVAYFAIARLGGVLSTVHMPYRTAEITTLLRHAGSVAFICYGAVKDFAPAHEVLVRRGELPALEHVIAVGEPVAGTSSFSELLQSKAALPADITPAAANPFLLLFTSGTSASPKAVPLTYQMTLGNARAGAVEHGLCQGDKVLSVAPFTHLLGLYALHLTTKVAGSSILFPAFTPPDLAQAITKHRPTVLVCAPAHLNGLMISGLLENLDLSSIRLIITAGSALSPDVAKAVSKRLPAGFLTNLWGMTELQAGLYTRPTDSFEIATTTSGRAAPGAEVRIADHDDHPVPQGEEGELQIRGGLLFRGYYNNEDATRQAFSPDRWFRTGDLAVMDKSGNVRITGRKTEIINRGGIKYNPLDIEIMLGNHPKVMEVAIVPYEDTVLGQKACCFVVPTDAYKPPTLEELCAHLIEGGVSKVKLPERLEVIDEMPITPTRKIIRGRLKALLAQKL